MSRAALNRQEANVQERKRQAEEAFRLAIDEGRSRHRSAGVLPLVGPDDTFNINPMLLHNISVSPYFYQKCYGKIKDWNALVDEIYYEVKHLEPWTPGALLCLCRCMCCIFCFVAESHVLPCVPVFCVSAFAIAKLMPLPTSEISRVCCYYLCHVWQVREHGYKLTSRCNDHRPTDSMLCLELTCFSTVGIIPLDSEMK